jgi:hypothetical protein
MLVLDFAFVHPRLREGAVRLPPGLEVRRACQLYLELEKPAPVAA